MIELRMKLEATVAQAFLQGLEYLEQVGRALRNVAFMSYDTRYFRPEL